MWLLGVLKGTAVEPRTQDAAPWQWHCLLNCEKVVCLRRCVHACVRAGVYIDTTLSYVWYRIRVYAIYCWTEDEEHLHIMWCILLEKCTGTISSFYCLYLAARLSSYLCYTFYIWTWLHMSSVASITYIVTLILTWWFLSSLVVCLEMIPKLDLSPRCWHVGHALFVYLVLTCLARSAYSSLLS